MRKKIYALILCISLVMGIIPIIGGAETYTEADAPVTLDITSSSLGNVFTVNDRKFTFTLTNTTAVDELVKITTAIRDCDGNVLSNETTTTYTVSGNDKKVIDYAPSITRNGVYVLLVKVSMRSGYYEDEIEFAIIPDVSDEKNQYLGICEPMREHIIEYNSGTASLKNEETAVMDLVQKAGFVGFRTSLTTWDKYDCPDSYANKAGETLAIETFWSKNKSYGFDNCWNVLGYSNRKYNKTDKTPSYLYAATDETTLNAFSGYCKEMATLGKKYGAEYYEMWNEFNLSPQFNLEHANDYDAYLKLLKTAHDAVEAIDVNAKIVSMCTSGSDIEFIRGAIEAGAWEFTDVVSIHPYIWGDYDKNTHLEEVGAVKDLLLEYTPEGKEPPEIWFTEVGWPTNRIGLYGQSEDEQAEYLVKLVIDSIANDICDRIYWYELTSDSAESADKEQQFGLLRSANDNTPYAAKKSFVAAAAMNDMMSGSVYKDGIRYDNSTVYRFEKSDGTEFLVLWADDETDNVNLDLGVTSIDCYDILGNKTETKTATDGKYTIAVGDEPIYVKGDFKKLDTFAEGQFSLSFTDVGTVNNTQNASYKITLTNNSDKDEFADISVTATGAYSEAVTAKALLLANGTLEKNFTLPKLSQGEYAVSIKVSSGETKVEHTATLNVTAQGTAPTVLCKDGLVTINGTTANASETVGVVIKSDKGIAYIEQLKSDTNCNWSTSATLSENGIYYAVVYDGAVNVEGLKNGISITTKIMKDEVEVDDITKLSDKDNVELHLTVHDDGSIGSQEGNIYCIIKAGELLLNVAVEDIKDNVGKEIIIPLTLKTPEKITGFSVLLWNKDMRPFTDKFNMMKGN